MNRIIFASIFLSGLVLSSCSMVSIISGADSDFIKRIVSRERITVSFIENKYILEDNIEFGKDRLYQNSEAETIAIPVSVATIYKPKVMNVFRKIFPTKNIVFVDVNEDFLIQSQYVIDSYDRMNYNMILLCNITKQNQHKNLLSRTMDGDLRLISTLSIDCKLSKSYSNNSWKKYIELFHKEWKPEDHTEEVGVWLEKSLQKYLNKNGYYDKE